jgi:hypothetical protein
MGSWGERTAASANPSLAEISEIAAAKAERLAYFKTDRRFMA